ncbi:Phosphate acyltransferase [Listeria monocytogenes]|nr:Phosphate acyltransferase [Listeria monocytogenes]
MTDGTIIKTDQVEQAKAFLESVTEVEVDGLQKAFKSMKSTSKNHH